MSDSMHYGKAAYGNLDELSGQGVKLDAAVHELQEAFRTLYSVLSGQAAAAVGVVEAQVAQNLSDWIARHGQQTRNAIDQHDTMHAQDNAVRESILGSYGGGSLSV